MLIATFGCVLEQNMTLDGVHKDENIGRFPNLSPLWVESQRSVRRARYDQRPNKRVIISSLFIDFLLV